MGERRKSTVIRTLTPKGQATRQRIIEGAAAEIRERGLSVTTLDEIRTRTVAEHEAQRVIDDQQPHLGQLSSWQDWRDWRNAVVDRYRKQGRTCPLSVLMTELGHSTPAARQITSALIRQWELAITRGIESMQDARLVPNDLNAQTQAQALVAGIQGGVSIMLATDDFSYLETALDTAIAGLRSGPKEHSTSA
jgi:hypothetical protein